MSIDELKLLAYELKEAREKAEVSLQHIASKTRIDLKFLKAIEEGDFAILPDVYITAFIKEYAALCNLDPKQVLEKYKLAKQGKPINPPVDQQETIDNSASEKQLEKKKEFNDNISNVNPVGETPSSNKRIFLYGGIGLLLILSITSYFMFFKNSSPDIVVEKPFEEVLNEQKKRFDINEEPSPQDLAVSADSLSLIIKADDTCWVNITIDEAVDKEYMLYRNSSIAVKAARKFDLIVGNAGGISLELNGNPVTINGTKGQRKIFSINQDGLQNSSN
ncbi:MAG: helix-turn-helix domain-containing protein [Melioribacteraceae bacterium]|jgi:transcriptional regulator with XRE-family HTH domain|nr:helix-turn-helix domain-containing protein [Melioribacteraceae bacterium]RJP59260.1 MAG: helix-turn-helix domain-containing protein [Ignavibacteriales bacterium]WKZ68636.1 MAG: helix-turn-helix domain-containing protein [Melioribacteraceae bacterium]